MKLGLCTQGFHMGCEGGSMVREAQATHLQALTSTKQDAGTELVPEKCAERHREDPVLQPTWTMEGQRAHGCSSVLPFISFV